MSSSFHWIAMALIACGCGDPIVGDPRGAVQADAGQGACLHGEIECEGRCTYIWSDPSNCGECGATCGADEVCRQGRCIFECPALRYPCGTECRDLATDSANCGVCGRACEHGEVCEAWTCRPVCSEPERRCLLQCVDLDTDLANCGGCSNACGSGEDCVDGVCTAP